MKRWLHIAEPCRQSWAAMPGDAQRRFCEACGMHVHDLTNLAEAEAERLLARAGRERVCVRVEHDDEGAIRFRPGGAARTALRLVGGASLLLAGCGSAGEPSTREAGSSIAVGLPPAAAHAVLQPAPSPAASSAPSAVPSAPAAPVPHIMMGAMAVRPIPPHSTMGCACVPGDPLCSCL